MNETGNLQRRLVQILAASRAGLQRQGRMAFDGGSRYFGYPDTKPHPIPCVGEKRTATQRGNSL